MNKEVSMGAAEATCISWSLCPFVSDPGAEAAEADCHLCGQILRAVRTHTQVRGLYPRLVQVPCSGTQRDPK